MKFIGTWTISEDKWLPILKKWVSMSPKECADAGESVEIIGRWHDVAARSGVIILPSDNLAAVQRYVGAMEPIREDPRCRLSPAVMPTGSRSWHGARSRI